VCRNVLELGSGTGFLGSVICSVCSPSSFTFSDCHDEVLDLLVDNVRRNLHFTGECFKPSSLSFLFYHVVICMQYFTLYHFIVTYLHSIFDCHVNTFQFFYSCFSVIM